MNNEQRRSAVVMAVPYSYSPTKGRDWTDQQKHLLDQSTINSSLQNKETGMKNGTAAQQTPKTHSYSYSRVAVPHQPLTICTWNIWPSTTQQTTTPTRPSNVPSKIQINRSLQFRPIRPQKKHTAGSRATVYISPCGPWCGSTQSICRLCVAKERGREAARHHMLPGDQDYQ
jgi:hypothetical protein